MRFFLFLIAVLFSFIFTPFFRKFEELPSWLRLLFEPYSIVVDFIIGTFLFAILYFVLELLWVVFFLWKIRFNYKKAIQDINVDTAERSYGNGAAYLAKDKNNKLIKDKNNRVVLIHSPLKNIYHFQYSILSQIPSILTALGIFGTFLGISQGLQGMGTFENLSSSSLMNKISPLLVGMSTAFNTSLLGIGFAIIFTFADRFLREPIVKNRIVNLSSFFARNFTTEEDPPTSEKRPSSSSDPPTTSHILLEIVENGKKANQLLESNQSDFKRYQVKMLHLMESFLVSQEKTNIYQKETMESIDNFAKIQSDRWLIVEKKTSFLFERMESLKIHLQDISEKSSEFKSFKEGVIEKLSLNEHHNLQMVENKKMTNQLIEQNNTTIELYGQKMVKSMDGLIHDQEKRLLSQEDHMKSVVEVMLSLRHIFTSVLTEAKNIKDVNIITSSKFSEFQTNQNETWTKEKERYESLIQVCANSFADLMQQIVLLKEGSFEYCKSNTIQSRDFFRETASFYKTMESASEFFSSKASSAFSLLEEQRVVVSNAAAQIRELQKLQDQNRSFFEQIPNIFRLFREQMHHFIESLQKSNEQFYKTFEEVSSRSAKQIEQVGSIAEQELKSAGEHLAQTSSQSASLLERVQVSVEKTLSGVGQELEATGARVTQELAKFRDAYSTALNNFFERQQALLEETLGSQREGLEKVVSDMTSSFEKQNIALLESHESQNDLLSRLTIQREEFEEQHRRVLFRLEQVVSSMPLLMQQTLDTIDDLSEKQMNASQRLLETMLLVQEHEKFLPSFIKTLTEDLQTHRRNIQDQMIGAFQEFKQNSEGWISSFFNDVSSQQSHYLLAQQEEIASIFDKFRQVGVILSERTKELSQRTDEMYGLLQTLIAVLPLAKK